MENENEVGAESLPRPPQADQSTTADNIELRQSTQSSCNIEPVNTSKALETQEKSSSIPIPSKVTRRLYISHFLSTWNSRLFEMGAVLFIAAIYPHTLRPMSVYALVRSAAAIVLSPAIGSWIDSGNRLNIVRVSILGQRLAVGASCGLFWLLLEKNELRDNSKSGLFSVTIILACIEKLCSVTNLVAVERDWVVVISEGNDTGRKKLNARMRRIDLFCKLVGPLAVSLIDDASTLIAVWATLAMSLVSVLIEYFAIASVFKLVPDLRRIDTISVIRLETVNTKQSPRRFDCTLAIKKVIKLFKSSALLILPLKSLPYYVQHPAFLPSISLSLLYLTVLSFSGQMITFLLNVGYSSFHIGTTRTICTIFELSATWIAPKVQQRIGTTRGGIWFLTWQMFWLATGISWFFASSGNSPGHRLFAASGLVGSVILSRVGLWGFDLCAQSIVQEEVNEQSRGAFSTFEVSFQNLFELLSFLTTIIFSKPDQFKWPAVISVIAVYTAGGTYATFVGRRRGHLFHIPNCIKGQ